MDSKQKYEKMKHDIGFFLKVLYDKDKLGFLTQGLGNKGAIKQAKIIFLVGNKLNKKLLPYEHPYERMVN